MTSLGIAYSGCDSIHSKNFWRRLVLAESPRGQLIAMLLRRAKRVVFLSLDIFVDIP